MKTVLDYINEKRIDENVLLVESIDVQILCEAFKCKALRNLQQEIFNYKKSQEAVNSWRHYRVFREIFAQNNWTRWSEVKDSDVTSYTAEDSNSAQKILRKILKGDMNAMGIVYDSKNKPEYIFINYNVKTITGDYYEKNYGGRRTSTPQYVKLDLAKNKAVDIIDLSNYDSGFLRKERNEAKNGMVRLNDPEYLTKLANENIRRYKDTVAKKHAERLAEEDETIIKLNEMVNKVLKLSLKFSENLAKYADKSWDVEQLVRGLYSFRTWETGNKYNKYQGHYSGRNGLLVLLSSYIDKLKDMHDTKTDGKSSYFYHDDKSSKGEENLKALENLRKEIDAQIKYVETEIEKIGIL